jgi:hypothetical protein
MLCGYFDEKYVEQLKGKQIPSNFPNYIYFCRLYNKTN